MGDFCEAPVIRSTHIGQIKYMPSFSYIAHFSRYIKERAQRIAVTCHSEKVVVTAFENPDSFIAAIPLNRIAEDLPAHVLIGSLFRSYRNDGMLPGESIKIINPAGVPFVHGRKI